VGLAEVDGVACAEAGEPTLAVGEEAAEQPANSISAKTTPPNRTPPA
jgi:hypothetical protein